MTSSGRGSCVSQFALALAIVLATTGVDAVASAAPEMRELAASSFSAGGQTLNPPDQALAEFGAAVSSYSDGFNDYVVVGAPGMGAGRAFYYVKPSTAATFGDAIELSASGVNPGDRFGASVFV